MADEEAKELIPSPIQVPAVYTIEDELFPPFEVKRGHVDAWWMNKNKVEKFIWALKRDYTVKDACRVAGITSDQYYYFVEIHPGFNEVVAACRRKLILAAKDAVATSILNGDTTDAKWLLERKARGEYGKDTVITGTSGETGTELIEEQFFDEEGNLKVKKKTLKFINGQETNREE